MAFEPRMFKGNAELNGYLNEMSIGMLKSVPNVSPSYRKNKNKINKNSVIDDYNIKMPEKEQEHLQNSDSDDAKHEIENDEYILNTLQKLNELFKNTEAGNKTGFLPGIN